MHPLRHPVFRWLFTAQCLSLLGIGIMTVGLALLTYDLAGLTAAGKVLSGLFALKMVAYVFLAPLAEALISGSDPKRVLIALDITRLGVLLTLGLATQIWQIALLSFVFYAVSAAFTPLFQAMIPAVLPEKETYTSALVLSRLAYTVESMLSPLLAAIALMFVTSNQLFPAAAVCLAGSVMALKCSHLSIHPRAEQKRPFVNRLSKGLTIYCRTPRLRGLFAMNLAVSFGLAWVLVNTAMFAGQTWGQSANYTYLMAAFGAGTAAGALLVPRLLQRVSERHLMLAGAIMFSVLCWLIFLPPSLVGLLMLWAGFGIASSWVLTPGGLVLTRSAAMADHPAIFAAQFSVSHAGWLLAYPTAGWLGAAMGAEPALAVLSGLCLLSAALGAALWPANDPSERSHQHPELSADHPHLHEHASVGNPPEHSHVFHIDDLHLRWGR